MRNSWIFPAAVIGSAAAIVAPAASAQDAPLASSAVSVRFPVDSPLVFIDAATGESRTAASGAATLIDLHLSLTLRNVGAHRIRSVKLGVVAQEVALGGRASMSFSGMNVAPGETFPVRIDTQLMKPFLGTAPQIQVRLDGVLFDDLSFYGSDQTAKRTMTARELEAQRDREYFRRIVAQSGVEGLKREVYASMERQRRPQLDLRIPRGS